MSSNLDFWKPIVGESWYMNYQGLFDSQYMQNVMNFLIENYPKSTIFPLQQDIFKAFRLTPFDKVKVVILGQEPYIAENENFPIATGLAYGNPVDSIQLSSPLKNIRRAVELSVYKGLNVNFDVTLEEWAEQGVLLLNTSLTVNKYKPGSHEAVWMEFTKMILKGLSEMKTGLHFCFWGSKLNSLEYLVNGIFHYKYESTHPSQYLKIGDDWECSHFNDINMNIIQQNGKEEIITW